MTGAKQPSARDKSISKLTVHTPTPETSLENTHMPRPADLASYEGSHHNFFQVYTAKTDGKQKVAEAVIEIAANIGTDSILDLGAGDGRLTALLASSFSRVVAVEKNAKYEAALSAIDGVDVHIKAMQEFNTAEKFGIILMSYSLSGVPANQYSDFMESLTKRLAPGGKILFVTYADGCPWDEFAEFVCSDLGIERTGGTTLHNMELQRVGLSTELLRPVETVIWGDDLKDLAETLTFFFLRDTTGYRDNLHSYLPKLSELSTKLPTGGLNIQVTENIIEILPLNT